MNQGTVHLLNALLFLSFLGPNAEVNVVQV